MSGKGDKHAPRVNPAKWFASPFWRGKDRPRQRPRPLTRRDCLDCGQNYDPTLATCPACGSANWIQAPPRP